MYRIKKFIPCAILEVLRYCEASGFRSPNNGLLTVSWETETPFTRVRTYFCRDKKLARFNLEFTRDLWNWTNFWTAKAPLTRVWTNLCADKNLHGSTLRSHETGGTGRIFERLSQVWDLKKTGQLCDRHGSIFRTDSCKQHPNSATFRSDSAVVAWNQMPRVV